MAVDALLLANITSSLGTKSPSRIPATLRALLDHEHACNLEQTMSLYQYDGDFEVVGSELGIDPPTMLCATCKELMRSPPPAESWASFHSTFFQIIDCCFRGSCHLCQLFWHGFQREIVRRRENREKFSITWYQNDLQIRLSNLCLRLNFSLSPEPKSPPEFHLSMQEDYDDEERRGPALANSTSSMETFSQIELWMKHCICHHPECEKEPVSNGDQPTRLIKIEDMGKRYRLIAEVPADIEYIALSYRWGKSKGYSMLTRDTATALFRGGPTAMLPRTLRDACSITRRLGLKHLWVDRLCIFQDSRADWEHEASRMARVYKHAFCTIAASCAVDEYGGCYRTRNALGIQPLKLTSNPLFNSGVLIHSDPPSNYQKTGKLGYIADRGWVFQERVLSKRTLYFGKEQVHWECVTSDSDETWPSGDGVFRFGGRDRPSFRPTPSEQLAHYEGWASIVEKYSTQKLTYESDKLPALSGLAREMQTATEDEYFAGLWRQHILDQLCWEALEPPKFPKTYRAPSWSWASLDSRIWYSSYPIWTNTENHFAECKNVRVNLAGTNPFGEVSDAWILLFAHLIPLSIGMGQATWKDVRPHRKSSPIGDSVPFIEQPHATWDIDPSLLDSGRIPVYCLPLLESGLAGISAMIVVPSGTIALPKSEKILSSQESGHTDEYQRVGLATFFVNRLEDLLEWLSESPKRDIIIR